MDSFHVNSLCCLPKETSNRGYMIGVSISFTKCRCYSKTFFLSKKPIWFLVVIITSLMEAISFNIINWTQISKVAISLLTKRSGKARLLWTIPSLIKL